jgi:hypothetical protein
MDGWTDEWIVGEDGLKHGWQMNWPIDIYLIYRITQCLVFLPVSSNFGCLGIANFYLTSTNCNAHVPFILKRSVVLNPTEEDIQLLLSAQCHIGAKNVNTRMTPYVYKRRADGKSETIGSL